MSVFVRGIILFVLTCVASAAWSERGRDGQVKIFYWQAPSILNPYLSPGIKDIEASSLVLEPLARFDDTGQIVPWLAESVPDIENGGVSEDMTSITWVLRDDLLWSDGTPVTSEDLKFTWAYCTAEGTGCAQAEKYGGIRSIETPDPRTAIVRFDAPRPFPYTAFVGATSPVLQAAQFAECLGPRAVECTDANFAPIGTGPFVVEEFRPNDVVLYAANTRYRDPDKPTFGRVLIKGGGTAETAARAVLETGEFDYAWNLQLAPDVLTRMESVGKGVVVSGFATLVERLALNLTDPDPALGKQRATVINPHPALSDPAVRQALSMAIDRALLVEIGYGPTGRVTCNILPAPEIFASQANESCRVQDIQGANDLLDAAGWLDSDNDGVRDKDGVDLRFLFQSSVNAVRKDFQEMIKLWWSQIGVQTELRAIDAAVFFGGDPGSPDTVQKFFADVQMFANMFDGTDPEAYLASWRCDRIPSPDNQWQGSNYTRYCNPDYDAMTDTMRSTGALEDRARLAKQMNDMLVQDFVLLPLVDRGRVSAHTKSLGGVQLNTWDSELWNIADWTRLRME
ncbi:MAG: peptide ABC transporter substrate-binding protein [Pseudomonadota bacterium]